MNLIVCVICVFFVLSCPRPSHWGKNTPPKAEITFQGWNRGGTASCPHLIMLPVLLQASEKGFHSAFAALFSYQGLVARVRALCLLLSENGEVLLRGMLTLRFASHAQPARLWKTVFLHIL